MPSRSRLRTWLVGAALLVIAGLVTGALVTQAGDAPVLDETGDRAARGAPAAKPPPDRWSSTPALTRAPDAPSARPRRFPNARTAGVPRNQPLRAYRGPCTITRDRTVIRGRAVRCDLKIRARSVLITHSKVLGVISSGAERGSPFSFVLRRSTVDASPRGPRPVTAVGDVHFRLYRSQVRGGNRSVNCWYDCVVQRSYLHGQDSDWSGTWHESGIRMAEKGVFRGNTIACDAPNVPPDGGCSAPLTGYGDFGPVRDNLIEGNLFKATPGGTCAYGGSSRGKPFSDDAGDIRFIDNVFERGRSGNCGHWAPVMDFDPRAPGNVWHGNIWLGGRRIRL